MKNKKEFIIGLVTAVTLVVFYWGLNFLKGEDLLSDDKEYTVIYDRVAGLNKSNPVRVLGHQVGKVSLVEMRQTEERTYIEVKFKVSANTKVPVNSIAKIESDILGVNSITLVLGDADQYAESGDTLNSAIATTIQEQVSLQMQPIRVKAEEMMSSLDSVLGAIEYIFNEETRANLVSSFQSINKTLSSLESASSSLDTMLRTEKSRLGRIFANVDAITLNLKKNDTLINQAIQNFTNISDTLAQIELQSTVAKVDKVLADFAEITDKINSGEGSLGQLVNNDTLYFELEETAKELHALTEDLKLNPHRYVHVSVFGKSSKRNPYVSPEEAENDKKKK
jgi:phospholipid/cholesterol/gamma-HCH transport system substrate-binding protein